MRNMNDIDMQEELFEWEEDSQTEKSPAISHSLQSDVMSEDTEGRYWLVPPEIYNELDTEFKFDFDPCPCPLPEDYNGLEVSWGKSNFVNPPFRKKDSPHGGPTAFVRKAIEEQKVGKTTVLLIPVQSYVILLLEAGAELRSAGRIKWLEADTKEPMKSPSPILCAILRPKD